MQAATRYVLSIDVEDYFQVEAFSRDVSRSDWDRWPSRVVDNTLRSLDLCDASGARATCFVVGWVARKFPQLVREIQSRGHELACHSFWHRPVFSLTPGEFREDLLAARGAIEDASGTRVAGYRAPSWSITAKSIWALDILAEEGFAYDSSIYPIHHDFYGIPGASRVPAALTLAGGRRLLEFPPASVRIGGATFPAAGGGYLRMLPFAYTRWSLRRMGKESPVVVVYFHPWEIDPEQPRIASRLKSRLRHYSNLHKMEGRLRALLALHSFQPFRDVLDAGFLPPAGYGAGQEKITA